MLAFYACPTEHWPKIRSTNPLERFNREIGRRTDVVGIFSDDASVIRVVSMLAIEANDEWLVGRSYISQKSMALLDATTVQDKLADNYDQQEVTELIAAEDANDIESSPGTWCRSSALTSSVPEAPLGTSGERGGLLASEHAPVSCRGLKAAIDHPDSAASHVTSDERGERPAKKKLPADRTLQIAKQRQPGRLRSR